MFSRKNEDISGKDIPAEWKESFLALLNETFEKNIQMDKKEFDLYGQIFDDELLVMTTYYNPKISSESSTSVFISIDLEKKDPNKLKKVIDGMVDLTGAIYDDIFSSTEFSDFSGLWLETIHEKQTYFYKISRENIKLTLEANKLLDA
jgi:hypothetical protein